jgi:hypothetical protein
VIQTRLFVKLRGRWTVSVDLGVIFRKVAQISVGIEENPVSPYAVVYFISLYSILSKSLLNRFSIRDKRPYPNPISCILDTSSVLDLHYR